LGLGSAAARVLAALQPGQLLRLLWVGAHTQPRAMARLLLHGLGPAASQLLTQHFEAADDLFCGCSSEILPVSRDEFYSGLYATVPDASAVLAALCRAQERLWASAARVVLAAHLGGCS
jgi:hypothetical protein